MKSVAKRGFTIVEISIATAFISVLMIAISIIIMNVSRIYQKGTTLKSLNSVGREIVDDINVSIEASYPVGKIDSTTNGDVTTEIKASSGEVFYRSNSDNTEGAFCPGQSSYIWSHDGSLNLRYKDSTGVKTIQQIRLLKVSDKSQRICHDYNISNDTIDISSSVLSYSPEDLLSQNEIDLYVNSLVVNPIKVDVQNQISENLGEVFISGNFTLMTNRGDKSGDEDDSDSNTTISNCSISDDEYDYCAINKFKFAARTAGKVY